MVLSGIYCHEIICTSIGTYMQIHEYIYVHTHSQIYRYTHYAHIYTHIKTLYCHNAGFFMEQSFL